MTAAKLGRPTKRPFRAALMRAIDELDGDPKALDKIARALLAAAGEGKIDAAREVADRLDGKAPQAITGDDDAAPISIVFTGVPRAGDGGPVSNGAPQQ